jgi:hypothetical protein
MEDRSGEQAIRHISEHGVRNKAAAWQGYKLRRLIHVVEIWNRIEMYHLLYSKLLTTGTLFPLYSTGTAGPIRSSVATALYRRPAAPHSASTITTSAKETMGSPTPTPTDKGADISPAGKPACSIATAADVLEVDVTTTAWEVQGGKETPVAVPVAEGEVLTTEVVPEVPLLLPLSVFVSGSVHASPAASAKLCFISARSELAAAHPLTLHRYRSHVV